MYIGCDEADLTGQSGTLNTGSCADRGFVNSSSISGGVVCYSGTTAGSRAVYICDDGFVLRGDKARICQSDGNWNGSISQCSPEAQGKRFSPSSIRMHIFSSLISSSGYCVGC